MDKQIRIEYEIAELRKNQSNIEIISTKTKTEYFIDITIPPSLFSSKVFNGDITFVLLLQTDKYPDVPPRLYCTTLFTFPQIADGRDLFREVFNSNWNENTNLTSLLTLLPIFINHSVSRQDLLFIGAYYLDQRYDLNLLVRCNFDIRSVKENILIKGKWTKMPRLLMISDVYFCLFDQDKKNKNKLTLVFWASINTIIIIKKILVNKMVIIHWAQKNTTEAYEMSLSIDKGNEIVDQLVNAMNYFGMNYNVTKEIKGQPPKIINNEIENNDQHITGENDINSNQEINIDQLEEEITKVEGLIKTNSQEPNSLDLFQLLTNYYDQAYYYFEQNEDKTKLELYAKKKEELMKPNSIPSN